MTIGIARPLGGGSGNSIAGLTSPAMRIPNYMSYANALVGWYVDNSGNLNELGGFALTDFLPIPTLSMRRMQLANDLGEYLTSPGGYYDADKQFISSIFASAIYEGSPVFVVPETARFVRVVFRPDGRYYLGFPVAALDTPAALSVLGDSIMTQFDQSLTLVPEILRIRMGFISVQNLAVGGLTLSGASGIASRCSQVSEFATHVLLEGGVNDWVGSVPLGTIADSALSTFYGACNYIADFFQTRRPYQKLTWLTPFRTGLSIANPSTLADYAAAVRAVGEARGISVVDSHNELPLNFDIPAMAALYSWDALHANDFGNSVIADFCAKALLR